MGFVETLWFIEVTGVRKRIFHALREDPSALLQAQYHSVIVDEEDDPTFCTRIPVSTLPHAVELIRLLSPVTDTLVLCCQVWVDEEDDPAAGGRRWCAAAGSLSW